MKKLLFVIMVGLFILGCQQYPPVPGVPTAEGFTLDVTASVAGGSWSNGIYTVPRNTPVTFTMTAAGGTSPYTYAWNFFDVNTYKSCDECDDEDPVHTFEELGLHYVHVVVTDSASAEEEAWLLIDVIFTASTATVNAVTDGSLDNTGTDNCTSDLETLISNNYHATNGLIVYFPDGIYKFEDQKTTIEKGSNYIVGPQLQSKLIIFKGESIGNGTTGTNLKFVNDSVAGDNNHDEDAMWGVDLTGSAAAPARWHWENLYIYNDLTAMGNTLDDFPREQRFIFSAYNSGAITDHLYISATNVDVNNFGKFGELTYARIKRSTFRGWGRSSTGGNNRCGLFNGYRKDSIWMWNYIQAGSTGETSPLGTSHVWYGYATAGQDNIYFIGNYSDGENAQSGRTHYHARKPHDNCLWQYNIIRNGSVYGIRFNYSINGQADDCDWKNNRFINLGGGGRPALEIDNLDTGTIENNFFMQTNASGEIRLVEDTYTVANLTFSDNVLGFDDSTPMLSKSGVEDSDYTETGTTSTNNKYYVGDPTGWYIVATGYKDPGVYEYVAPSITAAEAEGTSLSSVTATDGGSGLDSGADDARHPYFYGALIQAISDQNHFSEVVDYSASPAATFSINVDSVRVRDVDGNWTDPFSSSFTGPSFKGGAGTVIRGGTLR
jgi:hypothetical protein